jgi:hypothetical protein
VVNANGTVTVTVSGTWSWPGQNCAGRYGEGWAVDWWGISTSPTPSPSFSLTNASIVNPPGTTTTGTISPFGAIQINGTNGAPNTFFHVPQYYAGETVNSPSTCTDTGSGPTAASSGSWSATATYPSQADLPAQLCVNMYDEHGSEGHLGGNNDYSPSKDNDNSIQTNHFNPSVGGCTGITVVTQTIAGHIYLCNNGTKTTTEVPGGTLAASGPQTIAARPNPLGPTSVVAGTYTMTETNPSGYVLASACGTTSSTQSVNVPSGGAGVGIFYVTKAPPPVETFVGYADTFRPPAGSTGTPSPWQGASNATFIGCNPSFLYPGGDQCPQTGKFGVYPNRDYVDGGAIRFTVPPSGTAQTISNPSVQIGGCSFNPWPSLTQTIAPGHQLILSETGMATSSSVSPLSCAPNGENFDTSETNQTSCGNDGVIPVITVTINGKVTVYHDTQQILNTGGYDIGDCNTNANEMHAWTVIFPG